MEAEAFCAPFEWIGPADLALLMVDGDEIPLVMKDQQLAGEGAPELLVAAPGEAEIPVLDGVDDVPGDHGQVDGPGGYSCADISAFNDFAGLGEEAVFAAFRAFAFRFQEDLFR